jgi:hypothetical protein
MPITGRVCWPSGFAYVHAMSKSYVTVAQCAIDARRDMGRRKLDKDMAMVAWLQLKKKSVQEDQNSRLKLRNLQENWKSTKSLTAAK